MRGPRWHDDAVFAKLIGGEGEYGVSARSIRLGWPTRTWVDLAQPLGNRHRSVIDVPCEQLRSDSLADGRPVPTHLLGKFSQQQSGSGAHSRGRLASGDEDRVPYRGKRWGVGEVQSRHLLNGHVVPERGRGGVDPLGRALATDDLGPQQPSGVAFRIILTVRRCAPGK